MDIFGLSISAPALNYPRGTRSHHCRLRRRRRADRRHMNCRLRAHRRSTKSPLRSEGTRKRFCRKGGHVTWEQPKTPTTVTRQDLYRQVWETPMFRLGQRYGISGNGLRDLRPARGPLPAPGLLGQAPCWQNRQARAVARSGAQRDDADRRHKRLFLRRRYRFSRLGLQPIEPA
jgi:hypothetical protein